MTDLVSHRPAREVRPDNQHDVSSSGAQLPACDICFCSVCACGRHQLCRPTRYVYGHLDSSTEYGSNFVQFPSQHRKTVKPHLEIGVSGGPFEATTENRASYVARILPSDIPMKPPNWAPGSGILDGVASDRSNFPVWPNIIPPAPRPRRISSGSGDHAQPSSKIVFRDFGLQPRFVNRPHAGIHRNSETEKNGAGSKSVGPANKTGAEKPAKKLPSHRDVESAGPTYIDHPDFREFLLPSHIDELPPQRRFQATTTTGEAFQTWQLPPREPKRMVTYVKTNAPLESITTYSGTFQPVSLVPKNSSASFAYSQFLNKHVSPHPANQRFQATSTHRADFKAPPVDPNDPARKKNPKSVYIGNPKDDRDFITTTNYEHDVKQLPHCDGSYIADFPREKRVDGHVYIVRNG